MSHQRVPRSPSPIVTAVATAEFINDDRVSGVSTPRSRRHFLPRHSSRLVGINSLPDHDDFLPPTPSDSDSEDSPLVGRSRPIPRPQPSSTPITGVGELTLVRSNDSTNEAPMRVTMDPHLRTSPGDQAIAVSNMAFPSDLPPPLSNSGSTSSLQSFGSSSSATASDASSISSTSTGPVGRFETPFPPGKRSRAAAAIAVVSGPSTLSSFDPIETPLAGIGATKTGLGPGRTEAGRLVYPCPDPSPEMTGRLLRPRSPI